jgi:hypothetical protein
MNWFYAINGHRHGPVSEARLSELHHAGEIEATTFVWRKGFADWQPFATALPHLLPGAVPHELCGECRRRLPQSEMVTLNRGWICAACKPVFLQRLAEGLAPVLGVGQLWRQDHLLVLNAETPFPDRCIMCNAPAAGYRLKCQVYWAPTARIVLAPKRAEIHIGLCPRHRQHRQRLKLVSGVAIIGGLGLAFFGSALSGSLAGGGLLLGLFGLVIAGMLSSPVTATKMADDVIWLRGVGKRFLAELPQWTDPK